jgi:hypothetical protein
VFCAILAISTRKWSVVVAELNCSSETGDLGTTAVLSMPSNWIVTAGELPGSGL